jgi:hypothetical protein
VVNDQQPGAIAPRRCRGSPQRSSALRLVLHGDKIA